MEGVIFETTEAKKAVITASPTSQLGRYYRKE